MCICMYSNIDIDKIYMEVVIDIEYFLFFSLIEKENSTF